MGEIVVLSSDDGMETTTMRNRKSSEVVRWEKYLPKTVLRVLLVESDDSTRQIITALLRKCSYKVIAVSDGLAAWEILKEKKTTHNNIDLILTELDLPSISGFALLALVMEHEVCKNIPVIMMSSQDSITLVLKCMLRGAVDYLIKPMRKNELKNLWQHVWRRLSLKSDDVHNNSFKQASQRNLDEDSSDSSSRCDHSDQGSGAAQAMSYNGKNKVEEDVTMDLIGGIDKQFERCFYGDKARPGEEDEYVGGTELGLSLKRSCSVGSFFENQDDDVDDDDETKLQKLSLSDASAFSRFENSKPVEKTDAVVIEASSSAEAEPKTPTESHEKLRKVPSDTTTSSTNIGSSSINGQDLQVLQQSPVVTTTNQKQDSLFLIESNFVKANKEVEVGSQSTCSITEKPKEEEDEEEEGGGGSDVQERMSQREAALMKFRLKRKDRCFDKKVRYQSRKKLAEQRPRVKGQFVRAASNTDLSTTKA